jgi:hypothetical protein
MMLAQLEVDQPWYSNGAWLVAGGLTLLWLLYVAGKIRRRRK